MNKLTKTLYFGVFLCLGALQGLAVKAKPGVIDYIQGDGSVRQIILHGDEYLHYATTPDGRLLKLNDKGIFEIDHTPLSELTPVRDVSFRHRKAHGVMCSRSGSGQPKYRYSTSAFPTTGEPHSLVILVEYPDHGFNTENPLEYFEDFLNGDNFTRDGGTGSCRQFYIENSSGAFVPTFDVYGPVPLKNNRRYYGGGNETMAYKMVVEAVEYLDDMVDFSQYDHNGDGYVDSVYIIYSDKGEADGGPAESVWPYSWELESEGVSLWADGVKFNTYGCSNELQRSGRMEGIGTFTHEFGHVLGLPDLYNTNNAGDSSTPNEWSVMDYGSYNNDCRTPCGFSSFERYSLGWLEPEEIVMEGEYSLDPLALNNRAYILTTEENPDEFFMLEYRIQNGWDTYLPGNGMLVWHIDFEQRLWDINTPNNSASHQRIRLVRADNDYSWNTMDSDPFPGSKNINEFSQTTSPALLSWASRPLNVTSVNNITDEGKRLTFYAAVTEFRGDAGISDAGNDIFHIKDGAIFSPEKELQIYDISGRKAGVAAPGRPLVLEKGIYIIGGKKIMI